MKYLKITLSILLVTITLTSISAFASAGHYSITLKALKGVTQLGPKTKERYGAQAYYNIGTVNSCTGNRNTVAVMVKSERGGESAWIQVTNGATSSWGNDKGSTYTATAYNLYIKNDVLSPCNASHSGGWYLDQ